MRRSGPVWRSLFGHLTSGTLVLALTLTLGPGAALAQQEPQPEPAPPPPTSPPVPAPQGIPSTGNPRIDDLVTRVRDLFDSKREGFFPWLGGIMPGGWVAGGGGYRGSVTPCVVTHSALIAREQLRPTLRVFTA